MATQYTPQAIKDSLFARDWKKVIEIFKEHPEFYTAKITKSEDTVLHVVATHGANDTLVQFLDAMQENIDWRATRRALGAKNKQGDTPLHCAAARSSSSPIMCQRIVLIDPMLVVDRNNNRETPLFLAALHGHKETFLYLHSVASNMFSSEDTLMKLTPPWRRKGGETILHCTIQREYFELAFYIIHLYRDQFIASSVDEKGITPLHVLASKPSAFKSGTNFRWWSKILYYCMGVEPLKVPSKSNHHVEVELAEPPQNQSQDSHTRTTTKAKPGATLFDKAELPKNYHTCYEFFEFLWGLFQSVTWKEGIKRNTEREVGDSTSDKSSYFPQNYATCSEFVKSSYLYIFGLSGIGLVGVKKVKRKHTWCAQIMDELIKENSEYEWTDGGSNPFIDQSEDEQQRILDVFNKPNTDLSPPGPSPLTNINAVQPMQQEAQPKEVDERLEALFKLLNIKRDPEQEEMDKRMTALLVAAKNGVIEMVKKILERIPVAILDRTKEEKNILHVAVENRQPHIFNELKNHDVWDNLIETVDVNGNNVLHFAAKVSKYKPWQIPGSAMQMQWEIKWYQYVKEAVPQHLIFQSNNDDDTPGEIFKECHKELVKDGSEWLKSTAESCSVVAALIAGVSFATSSQVPGGSNDTGEPNLEGHPAFNVFAITSLVALCFSITALVMFLAILTSRQQPKDFRRDLPFKLLLGLSSLLVSIASILVSYCAAYFFVLKDRVSTGLYIIYTATCLPVSFYAVAQFPLYFDLLKAILTEVPQPSSRDDDL
ncbi:hypothetical protein L6164_034507 [Bauhinia variegata]|uniref:Uncharacterized protein n=1 Tax=Bauhinia variegata TaxID=167791 RepID=A0ACB9KV50_BAUVA|nr:hypothetical protein L6164_034507 [Bauhinia variegata]